MSLGPFNPVLTQWKTSLFDSSLTSSADFSTGYQWIGLPSSVWLDLCNAYVDFVNHAFPTNTYPRNAYALNVYCDSSSNVNKLLTMDFMPTYIGPSFNFTVSMADSTGTEQSYTINLNSYLAYIYNAT
jgi:hypothetical protein